MRIIIAGGRDYYFKEHDYDWLSDLHDEILITEVVSGKATGADSCGEIWANDNDIPIIPFPAIWKRPNGTLNKVAGHIRNEQMARYADAVVLFPGGNGTANMRKNAIIHGLIIYEPYSKDI